MILPLIKIINWVSFINFAKSSKNIGVSKHLNIFNHYN